MMRFTIATQHLEGDWRIPEEDGGEAQTFSNLGEAIKALHAKRDVGEDAFLALIIE